MTEVTSNVHECVLPHKDTSGLPQIAPNASCDKYLLRRLRKLIIVNPNNFRCSSFFQNKSATMTEQRRHIRSRYSYMIHPFSYLNAFLEVSFSLLWLLKMLIEPVVNNMLQKGQLYTNINYFGLIFMQYLLMISFFFVGYIDQKTREIIIQPRRVGAKYLMTYFFFDLLACDTVSLVATSFVGRFIEEDGLRRRLLKVSYYIQVPCLYVRLATVLNYLDDIWLMMKMRTRLRKGLHFFVKTCLYLHLMTCTLYFVPQLVYLDEIPPSSWLAKANIAPNSYPKFYTIYGECLEITACNFFGASSGKYDITESNEQISLSIIGFVGRLYTLFLLAEVLSTFGVVGLSKSNYERKLAELKEYMISNQLPKSLKTRMLKYYEYKYQRRYFNEQEILRGLSEKLRSEIYLFSARTLLLKSKVFSFIPETHTATLISMMKLETFAPGDIIIKFEQQSEYLYFISQGSVMIMSKGGLELCHLEDGEVLGLHQILKMKQNYSVVVLETTDMYVIGFNELCQFMEQFEDAQQYMTNLAIERLHLYRQLEKVAVQRSDSCLMELKMGKLLEPRQMRSVV